MEKGTKLIHSASGYNDYSETIIFDQFVGDKIMAVTEDGQIRMVHPDHCKLANLKEYLNPPMPMCG